MKWPWVSRKKLEVAQSSCKSWSNDYYGSLQKMQDFHKQVCRLRTLLEEAEDLDLELKQANPSELMKTFVMASEGPSFSYSHILRPNQVKIHADFLEERARTKIEEMPQIRKLHSGPHAFLALAPARLK